MSVNDEKMLILKMLEEGKITSEEAAKLIDALDSTQKDASGPNTSPTGSSDKQGEKSKFNNFTNEFKSKQSGSDFDRIMDDFSVKVEKLGRNLAETTFGLVDKMTDFMGSFVDTNSFRYFGNLAAVDKNFSAEAIDGMKLTVEGRNGQIIIKKNSGSKIEVNSRIRSHSTNTGDIISFENNNGVLSLKLNNPSNMSVSHEISLPAVQFKEIKLTTSNAKIYIEDSISESLEAVTKNGQIELMGVNCGKIVLTTKNSRIRTGSVTVRDIEISTSNSGIEINHIKAQTIKASTSNGRVTIEAAQNHEDSNEMGIFVKSRNGRIKINMNDNDTRGYKVKAQTTHGQINLLIPDMLYKNIDKQSFGGSSIETESSGYEAFTKKVFINAETTNSYIEIGK